jgi:hypothetical protein
MIGEPYQVTCDYDGETSAACIANIYYCGDGEVQAINTPL